MSDSILGPDRTGTDDSVADDDGISLSGEATKLIKDPRSYIVGIVVGMLFGLFEAGLESLLLAGGAVRDALANAGDAGLEATGSVGETVIDLVELPFGTLETLAVSSGPLAPLVVAITWAVVAALVGALIYGLWRLLPWT